MSRRRLFYREWIVEIGTDPQKLQNHSYNDSPLPPNPKIIAVVKNALGKLTDTEQAVIERYYYQGESFGKIAEVLNCKIGKAKAIHDRAITKMRKNLAHFVRYEFGVKIDFDRKCPICCSIYRGEIDKIIKQKSPEETWRKIIQILKKRYNIEIKTPQILIGHNKYHIS